MNNRLIEKVIELIPSKDLRNSYKEDISNGIYPEWSEEECLTVVNMCSHNISEEINYFKQVAPFINNVQLKDSIDVWIK